MISALNEGVVDVAESLLAVADVATRARLAASSIAGLLPDSACAVLRLVAKDSDAAWTVLAVAGEISVEQSFLETSSRLIAPLLSEPGHVLIYAGADIRREDYAHLGVARSVTSLAYIPLLSNDQLAGAVEVLSFSSPIAQRQLDEISEIVRLVSPAILAAEDAEQQRQTLLNSVHRMTQLYDLEKSLNSTLELDAVIAMIPVKAAAMLPCQAIHLWLFDGGILRLVSSCGQDATVEVGAVQAPGEGYVADMAEQGESLLITGPDDERLSRRNAAAGDTNDIPPVTDALLVALIQDDAEVGVIEAINREGRPFDEDDEFFLVSMAETVSSALKNASLMHAERKLEILEALVHVSSEITSTLRLDRLLQIIVNSPQNVLPYELCAIALDYRGRLQLKAISGMANLPMGDIAVERAGDLVRYLSSQPDAMHLLWHEGEDSDEKAGLPPEVLHHFEETGYRAMYSVPLNDDQGRVGVLIYESREPDFLDQPQKEMIKILAGQATVAIRNALLYREVPLISLIEPLMQRRAALLRTTGRRRLTFAATAAVVVLLLIFCPLPMRVSGVAVVVPQHLVTVAAPVDGNVDKVYAHEGQRVAVGEILATINDWQWRANLAAAEARYQQAQLAMEDDLAHGSARAGADRANVDYLRDEVARSRTRLESAQLRSPIAGIVVTPNLQNAAGEHLDAGAAFAQVLDLNSAVVQIAVPERDAMLVSSGESAAIKLDSYPRRTWRHPVSVVSPQAIAGDGERTFSAEVPLPNDDATLRAGMSGKGKIAIGLRPSGYVLLRRPALWLWQTLWNWIGW